MSKWTQKDEKQFKDLAKRREDAMSTIRALADEISGKLGGDGDFDRLQGWLIERADEIRDALAPFDSGVRVAESPNKEDRSQQSYAGRLRVRQNQPGVVNES